MKLTSKLAKDYATLNAKVKALELERESMCTAIKDEMRFRKIDEFAPIGSPFKLVKTEYDRTNADYEDMAIRAYRQLYGKAWKAQFEKDMASYGKTHVVSLEPKPNENWVEEKVAV